MTSDKKLPLEGIRVCEFTHMVMGPMVGLVLAELGADVVKIEPVGGDNTRRLVGSGAGYFPMYARGKRSVALDMKSPAGKEVARRLVGEADVLIENFRPGAMDKLGFGYDDLSGDNPGLIYCSEKGFLEGPYGHRTALDEVAQMMGGLAYMTGPPGRPLRAGASVIDVTGGMFGAIAVLAALEERHRTGKGQLVKSALFESTAFLVGQHMAQHAVTGQPAAPMPARVSAWAIYDIFETAPSGETGDNDGDSIFVGVVSDSQWTQFCTAFGLDDLGSDPALAKNAGRVAARETLLPRIRELFKGFSKADLMEKLEHTGLPFAPIAEPSDLFDDPHLSQSGGLLDVTLPGGTKTRLPALPIEMDGRRPGQNQDLPGIGAHTAEVLRGAGYSEAELQKMAADGVILLGV